MSKDRAIFGQRKCRCGAVLPKPTYGLLKWRTQRNNIVEDPRWHQKCKCGIVHVWTFPNVWYESVLDPIAYIGSKLQESLFEVNN